MQDQPDRDKCRKREFWYVPDSNWEVIKRLTSRYLIYSSYFMSGKRNYWAQLTNRVRSVLEIP